MTKLQPWIDEEKRKGVEILLRWVIGKYSSSTSVIGKRLWFDKKEFLADLQRQQTYSESDKEEYNKIREQYYLDRRLKLLFK